MPLVVTSLDKIPQLQSPCGLTIGTFDGVHLGHQSLLQHLRTLLPMGGILTVLTFSNHPSHLFSCQAPIPLIYPPKQKVKHLFDSGADLVILVPFDNDFAQIPYDDFLTRLKKRLGFTVLTLGEGATFGQGKQGDAVAVKKLGNSLDFTAEYLRKISLHHHSISSGRIRGLIQQGALQSVTASLGRSYSLMGHPIEQGGRLFCPFPGICLPPQGKYAVNITQDQTILVKFTEAEVSLKEQGIYLNKMTRQNLLNKEVFIEFIE